MMNLASLFSSLLRRMNANGKEAKEPMATAVCTTMQTAQASEPTTAEKVIKLPKLTAIDTQCGYQAIRRFLFRSAYPRRNGEHYELLKNPHILIERDALGQIYVEADGKRTLYEMEENVRIINTTYCVGIIYNSKSGKTTLRWRDGKPTGRLWGHVTPRSLATLLSCNIRVKELTPPILAS